MTAKPWKARIWKFAGILAGLILVLFLLLVVLILFDEIPFRFVGLLLFGWVAFLERTIPQLTFNREIAFDAAVALALALFGLHRILCWWTKQRGEEARLWRFGWTVKITVMVLLLFAASISAVGIVHQIAWLCREPHLIVMGGRSKQTVELYGTKMLVTAAILYSTDNKDRFPPHLGVLVPDYSPDSSILYTRGMGGDPPQPYLYFPGYGAHDDPQTIIIASPRPMGSTDGGRRAVAHIDGSAVIIPEAKFQELIQKQHPAAPAR